MMQANGPASSPLMLVRLTRLTSVHDPRTGTGPAPLAVFDQMTVEGDSYQLKPMNCPFHVLVYKDDMRSYRDLPLRWAELGTVYRYERSGTLQGLFRVRGFTQDDAHIFCLPEQLADEITTVKSGAASILRALPPPLLLPPPLPRCRSPEGVRRS